MTLSDDGTQSLESEITVINYLPRIEKDDLRKEIITGLTADNKHISSKFFYDAIGSKLFEKITGLPEYYVTRTERAILKEVANEIGNELKDYDIVELGSGDCSKISILFDAMPVRCIESVRYIPVDFSKSAIEKSANILVDNFSGLEIRGLVADFTRQLKHIPSGAKRLFCFFGSTLGNFTQDRATKFLARLSEVMNSGDILLLGVDMVKNKDILEKAYNDSRQVTAEFNRNILNVVNKLVDTNFNTDDFEHVAFFNEKRSRIEMHLKASKDLKITSPHLSGSISIKQGETIHTENSHKFTDESINQLASDADLEIKNRFTDNNKWFSVIQLVKNEKVAS